MTRAVVVSTPEPCDFSNCLHFLHTRGQTSTTGLPQKKRAGGICPRLASSHFLHSVLHKEMPKKFFSGKVVLITGSSDGIGRATAVLFAKKGAMVTVTGRSAEKLAITKAECVAAGARVQDILEVVGDITDKNFIETLIQKTIDTFCRLDVLVNNAGAVVMDTNGKTGMEIPIDVLDDTMDINVRSVVLVSQQAIPHLEKRKGAIVNVSSNVSALFAGSAPYYSMSKTCLDQLTVQMAGTLIKKGIRVNSVNPGVTRTNILSSAGWDAKTTKDFYDASVNSLIPLGKTGVPEDIAKIIVFLSDRSQSEIIVGQRIFADGGSTLMNPLLSVGL